MKKDIRLTELQLEGNIYVTTHNMDDDEVMLNLAANNDGVIISNDQYRNFLNKEKKGKLISTKIFLFRFFFKYSLVSEIDQIIMNRRIGFQFVNNTFCVIEKTNENVLRNILHKSLIPINITVTQRNSTIGDYD